jgi:hypothetical protein
MEILSKVINSRFFMSGVIGAITIALIVNGSTNYAWFAGGVGVRQFLLSFKK